MADLRERMDRGRAVRREVFGDEDETAWEELGNEFDPEFNEYMLGLRWGTITARPGLDARTRQLCAFATFLTIGEYEQVFIERQIRGALNCGATPQEVVEVILQTGLFAGLYKWAIRKTAIRIFKEMGYKHGVDWASPFPESGES